MSWSSTTPAVLTTLVEVFKAADGITPKTVVDGPLPSDAGFMEALSVGHTDEFSPSAVEGTLGAGGLAVTPDREEYTVQCAASVLNGSSDMVKARARAYDLFAAARQALERNHTLDGLVMMARPETVTLTQFQTTQGAVATVVFGVAVSAFTRR